MNKKRRFRDRLFALFKCGFVWQLHHKNKDTIIVIMIDFVKCWVINMDEIDLKRIKKNPLLDFTTYYNEKTTELARCSTAIYRGLKFKVYDSTNAHPLGRLTIEGSLHKYWNMGKHNCNDFSVANVQKVLTELWHSFGVHPNYCIIKQLELGINFDPEIRVKAVIDNCFMFSTKRFGWQWTRDEGNYIQSVFDRKTFKIYDKALQFKKKCYPMTNQLIRIEVKFTKMQQLNEANIYSLADLVNYGLADYTGSCLLTEWGKVLFYDSNLLEGHKNQKDYANPNYWIELAKTSSRKFKYHRNNLNVLYDKESKAVKKRIAKLIIDKISELNT